MMFEIRRPSIRRCVVPIAIQAAACAFTLTLLFDANSGIAQTLEPVDVYHSINDDGVHPDPAFPPGCTGTGGGGGTDNVLVLGSPAFDAGAVLVGDLLSFGHTVTHLQSLPADLSTYDSIWFVDTAPISIPDQGALAAYIQGGGGVHLTGERPCCEAVNASASAVVNAVVTGGGITVGGQGDIAGPYPFNAASVGNVATTPNALANWVPFSPGGIAGLDAENVLVSGASTAVGAVWVEGELLGGAGRLTVLMDWNWLNLGQTADRRPVIENIQTFLASGTGGGVSCVLAGGSNEQLNLWIDGGGVASGEGETVCKFGPDGGMGDNLCGADMLIEMNGGSFTAIEPTVDTLVCNPSCANCDADETGICSLPADTTSIRMNFRRGDANAPPAAPPVGPRRVATLFVDTSGNSSGSPSEVFATGVGAAGANLQLRRIANAADACTAVAEPFSCCTGAGSGNGEPPCGPRLIATSDLPEPAQVWQLVSGLAGLGYLYRMRRRA